MDHPRKNMRRSLRLLLLCSLLPTLQILAQTDDPPFKFCPERASFASDNVSIFQDSLSNLLSSISSNASVSKYFNTSSGDDPDSVVYGQFMCLNYNPLETCRKCAAELSSKQAYLCPNTTEAVIWGEQCQLRYSNANFLGRLDVSGNQCKFNQQNSSNPRIFRDAVDKLLYNLTNKAAFDPSANLYATGKANSGEDAPVYGLVQCTLDLSSDECQKCLRIAIQNVSSSCYASRGARVLSHSCYLRYELYSFYEADPSFGGTGTAKDAGNGKKVWKIVVLSMASAAMAVILIFSIAYYLATRKEKTEISRKNVQFHDIGDTENPDLELQDFEGIKDLKAQEFYIDFAAIEAATDNFSDSNMLGKGGFGPVYKGILNDGKEVAVKRLSSCSEQGTAEFINEVLLILKLQHKNLVRLLGFCVERGEKLLVYEYLPNSSLDFILLDPKRRAQLNWTKRMNIINGIARGILYLHEDSRLRIIHRDLKPSNVLLDCEMNPKISDFGMARIFAGAEDEATTGRIVGTFGYMPPEYAMDGLYSTKSDIFSFGVILLEIISGKRNAGFRQTKRAQTPSLLAYAWELWNQGEALQLMDPLITDAEVDEFVRYVQIALLCVQGDANDRPNMSSVVVMLKGEDSSPGKPERPPFSVGRRYFNISAAAPR